MEQKFCQSCGMPLTDEIPASGIAVSYWSVSPSRADTW